MLLTIYMSGCNCQAYSLLFGIPLQSMPLFNLEGVGFSDFPYSQDMTFTQPVTVLLCIECRCLHFHTVSSIASPFLLHTARCLIYGAGWRHFFHVICKKNYMAYDRHIVLPFQFTSFISKILKVCFYITVSTL